MKRQRGRGRRPGGGHQHNNYNNPNRQLESTGPENTKVRGSASIVFERYQQYARDAASSGDRVLSENYLQHADHYFRLWRATQPATPLPQPDRFVNDGDHDGDDEFGHESEVGEEETAHAGGAGNGEQAQADYQQEREPRNHDRDADPRRRRGRRNRFRPAGGEPGGEHESAEAEGRSDAEGPRRERDDGEPRREREGYRRDRPPREDRRPREADEPRDTGPEGFSSGPKPAFLRSE